MVRLDEATKTCLAQAAKLRQISVSDYVRTVTLAQARREIKKAAQSPTISLSPEEQLAFWKALCAEPKLTRSQRRLGATMRGEA
jgi:uncharacterized protein (DUF1778 family)